MKRHIGGITTLQNSNNIHLKTLHIMVLLEVCIHGQEGAYHNVSTAVITTETFITQKKFYSTGDMLFASTCS